MQECNLKETAFENCKLVLSNLFKTNLNKIDFRDNNINGITVRIEDLKGAIVSEYQALELSRLIGIIIK